MRQNTEMIPNKVAYLSEPADVSMADRWFEIASTDHFWIRRRFAVLQKLAGKFISASSDIAEIGCGNGLLQRQIEESYGKAVAGFDLNDVALTQNVSQSSPVYCYDILQRRPDFEKKFDLIFLFDVLEHITDERTFLEAVRFHLSPSGILIINVPAGQQFYSRYDQVAGHVRRYSIQSLRKSAKQSDFSITNWTYWGLPLLPAVILRKLWLQRKHEKDDIIRIGFDSRTKLVNQFMRLLAGVEVIPQRFIGTSLMAVLKIQSES